MEGLVRIGLYYADHSRRSAGCGARCLCGAAGVRGCVGLHTDMHGCAADVHVSPLQRHPGGPRRAGWRARPLTTGCLLMVRPMDTQEKG